MSDAAPAGWTSHYDAGSNRTYYVNDTTQETSWDLPAAAPPSFVANPSAPSLAPTPVVAPPASTIVMAAAAPPPVPISGGVIVSPPSGSTSTGGGDELNVPSFGPVLYQIDQEEKNKHFVLRFHQNFIVIYESEKFCCYPHGYSKNILPRCSVIGAEIHKASVNKLKIIAGWYAVVIGLVLIIVGKPSDSAEAGTPTDDNSYVRRLAEQSTSELMMMIAGIILILVGAFHILYPCVHRTYTITLKLMRESPAPTACFGIIKLPAPTIKLTVDGQPEDRKSVV